ncbi:alanyl-tRNA editing protein [Halolamina salifodinae]|uniref:Alanyl-tRNA synthetase n=1 Tax=Halolamina salifodinae TaxID=1202767 RepID=A0A8T4GYR6_9EURY|nr:alanine--tRNA ligase-related protein [Halolamina salifodinae]MBP1986258.1 alanyl-tRNA synthetase [Halolamina salifodinae]
MQTLAPDNPETLSFDTEVAAVDGREVILHETYFYPEGGGQPADRGVIDDIAVADVQKSEAGVVHRLSADHDLEKGETVHCVVDAAFRTYCKRAHTASHVLFGAARRVLDDVGYAGFDIGEETVRVDFTADTEITDERMIEMERLANRAVWDSLPVSWEYQDPAVAREREEVAFNTKTEEGAMAESDEVRIVTIEGWDVAACGGTHVSNTSEIGPLHVLERSNPGEGATRVEFAVGPTAIDAAAEIHEGARAVARDLDVAPDAITDAVGRLTDERDDLRAEVADLKSELLGYRLADLDRVGRDGGTWLVGAVEGATPNELQGELEEYIDDGIDGVAVAGTSGETFVVVATDGDADANAVVQAVTGEFGGGGGGGPTFAQGGGIPVSPPEVVGYLRSE